MDDALLKSVVERAAAFETDLQHVRDGQQGVRADVARQVPARDQLHGDVAPFLLHRSIEDRHDVRVAQLARERGLVQKLQAKDLSVLRILEHRGVDRLQRDLLPRERVFREVNGARRSLAEHFLHLVLADLEFHPRGFFPGRQGGRIVPPTRGIS